MLEPMSELGILNNGCVKLVTRGFSFRFTLWIAIICERWCCYSRGDATLPMSPLDRCWKHFTTAVAIDFRTSTLCHEKDVFIWGAQWDWLRLSVNKDNLLSDISKCSERWEGGRILMWCFSCKRQADSPLQTRKALWLPHLDRAVSASIMGVKNLYWQRQGLDGRVCGGRQLVSAW